LPAAKIQSIEFKPATGSGYTLHRLPSGAGAAGSAAGPATAVPAPASSTSFTIDGVPKGRSAAEAQRLAPSPTTFSALSADDVAQAGDTDFSMPSIVTVTMDDGNIVTFTGATTGNKRWIKLAATKDAALNAKTAGRAFEIAAYRYDSIFRPLEQLLVPKEAPADAKKPGNEAKVPATSIPGTSTKKLAPAPTP
jgi:hypothetical protein